MMRIIAALLGMGLLSFCASCSKQASAPRTVDLQITGGQVFDGVSEEGVVADVFIQGERIVFVGAVADANMVAAHTIDAQGMIVAPGFIDPHTHTFDDVLFSDDGMQLQGYLTQGVTTVAAGNDGGGPVNVGAALSRTEERGVGPNYALFAGHRNLRMEALGRENRAPTEDEMQQMKTLLEQALRDGALGLSTGLYYAPGSYAQTEEIVELAKVAAAYDALYESHIRDESSYSVGLLAAIDEALDIGARSGAAVHIAHIKALGADVWGMSEQVISRIEAAQADGQRVTADQYPWSASGTRISNALIPNWVKSDSDEAMRARLTDPANQERLEVEIMENLRKRGGPDAILLVATPENPQSRTLTVEMEARGLSAIETAIQIVLEGDAAIASFVMSDPDIENFMAQDWVMTSSDGTNGHPRKAASFPQKYQTYVVEKSLLTMGQFIHRSTSLTADTLQLCDRGRLAAGAFADIVIFDPDTFAPVADYSNPTELSVGVQHLIVNGEMAIVEGALTNRLSGQALRRAECHEQE